jgi:membrane fusion protein (multidrug efflux system)
MSEQQKEQAENGDSGNRGRKNGGEGQGNGRRKVGIVLLVLILAGTVVGAWLWYKSKIELSTDDAFIESHIHTISPRVSGQVERVAVKDNQQVAAGDLMVALDDADYQARVAKAEARLRRAENQARAAYAGIEAAKARVDQARAELDQAGIDLRRGEALFEREVIPRQRLDQLRTADEVARSTLAEARQALARARAEVAGGPDGLEARVAERKAELETARLELSYTRITAPVAGYVTRKSVEPGNNVRPGQPLLSLVQLETPWIVANYKESQLTHMEPGQKVEFTVDAFPGRTFTGRVESIMAGTGAAFALLPPENATGNYVKVVQRVPVKIAIDADTDPDHVLRVGLSVVPTIYTGRSLGDILVHLNPFN